MDRKPLTCRETTWLVSDARERDLTPEEKRDLVAHVEECPFCSRASVQFEVLFRQLGVYFARHPSARAGDTSD